MVALVMLRMLPDKSNLFPRISRMRSDFREDTISGRDVSLLLLRYNSSKEGILSMIDGSWIRLLSLKSSILHFEKSSLLSTVSILQRHGNVTFSHIRFLHTKSGLFFNMIASTATEDDILEASFRERIIIRYLFQFDLLKRIVIVYTFDNNAASK